MSGLRTLLFALAITSVSGWWWGRRRIDINNCHCGRVMKAILSQLDKLEQKKIATRDIADILNVDEDYPGFEDFAAHLDTKREGSVDKQELASAIRKGLGSISPKSNTCSCGRKLLDKFNKELL